jgi:hypothetical protein
VKVAMPAIATMARPGILARLRARCIKDKLSPLLCVGSETCEQMPSRRSSWQLESDPLAAAFGGNSVHRIRNDNTTILPLVGFAGLLSCCPAWCRLLHTRSRPVVRADRRYPAFGEVAMSGVGTGVGAWRGAGVAGGRARSAPAWALLGGALER